MATNAHELSARLAKAHKIAAVLLANDYRSHVVAGFNDDQRSLAASAARQKKPSDETWAVVIKILRQQEEANRASRRTVEDVDKLFERVGGR